MLEKNITVNGRQCSVRADDAPEYLLIQPADSHELELFDKETEHIRSLTDIPFAFAAFEVTDWNSELSPWEVPAVFGTEPFGNGAQKTLEFIETALIPELRGRLSLADETPVILGGYSLAALFALWAGYVTDSFAAVSAASPSVWFPGWTEFTGSRSPAAGFIYLSLGKKEEKTRNRIMAAVGDNIRLQYETLRAQGTDCIHEWNEGNHFTEPELRTAKGFARCMQEHRAR